MKFTKIKWNAKEKKVSISWVEEKANGDTFDHNLTSPDAPRPEFLEALNALAPAARRICECGAWGEGLRPIGVSLSTSKEGARGVVITCLKNVTISPAPIVLNTPHLAEDAWPGGLYESLFKLEREAELYVHGERAQQEMFGAEKPSEGTVTVSVPGHDPVTLTSEQLAAAARG